MKPGRSVGVNHTYEGTQCSFWHSHFFTTRTRVSVGTVLGKWQGRDRAPPKK